MAQEESIQLISRCEKGFVVTSVTLLHVNVQCKFNFKDQFNTQSIAKVIQPQRYTAQFQV